MHSSLPLLTLITSAPSSNLVRAPAPRFWGLSELAASCLYPRHPAARLKLFIPNGLIENALFAYFWHVSEQPACST